MRSGICGGFARSALGPRHNLKRSLSRMKTELRRPAAWLLVLYVLGMGLMLIGLTDPEWQSGASVPLFYAFLALAVIGGGGW